MPSPQAIERSARIFTAIRALRFIDKVEITRVIFDLCAGCPHGPLGRYPAEMTATGPKQDELERTLGIAGRLTAVGA